MIRQNPMRAMLVLAFPMIVGNLFQQFYNMVDSVIVGRYVGEEALAAVEILAKAISGLEKGAVTADSTS